MKIKFDRCSINLQLIQGRGGLLGAATGSSHGICGCSLLRLFCGRVALVPLLNLDGLFQVRIVTLADILFMGLHIVQNLGFQRPPKKVQLSNRGHELLMIGDRKHDALATAVRVKILLGIGLELSLVAEIDEEFLAVKGVANEALTTVFGDEPINDTKTKGSLAIQINEYFINFRMVGIKSLQTGNDELGLAFDFTLSGLWITEIYIHV